MELVSLDAPVALSNTIYSGPSYIVAVHDTLFVLDEKNLSISNFNRDGELIYHSEKKGRGSTKSLEYQGVIDLPMKDLRAVHLFAPTINGYILYSLSDSRKLWAFDGHLQELKQIGYQLRRYPMGFWTS